MAAVLMPLIVTGDDVITAETDTLFWSTNVKLFGVVSSAVVLVKLSATPPIVRTVLMAAPDVAAVV